ncbi:Coproporphyrinogen III oxidase [Pisolithus sp. B1]|nr:Coproporphyrinogen III oxidase [Pisolithus sp. B1]
MSHSTRFCASNVVHYNEASPSTVTLLITAAETKQTPDCYALPVACPYMPFCQPETLVRWLSVFNWSRKPYLLLLMCLNQQRLASPRFSKSAKFDPVMHSVMRSVGGNDHTPLPVVQETCSLLSADSVCAIKSSRPAFRERVAAYMTSLQEQIVAEFERDGLTFRRESWSRHEGGGGPSCTFPPAHSTPSEPSIEYPIEEASVNVSRIYGTLSRKAVEHMRHLQASLKEVDHNCSFFATGLSLMLHPRNPHVSTVHANYRYFEVLDGPLTSQEFAESVENTQSSPKVLAWWFGAIADLNPMYLYEDDVRHFHSTLKEACDLHRPGLYSIFKASCDDYIYIPHRNEYRGVGGVRFGEMDSDAMRSLLLADEPDLPEVMLVHLSSQESLFEFVQRLGNAFLPSFLPILNRRSSIMITDAERQWQLYAVGVLWNSA